MSRLREEVLKDPERWPLLVRASRDVRQAETPKVEWPSGFNYMQIFRQRDKETLLDQIEYAFAHGHRNLLLASGEPIGFIGGVKELLGRDLTDDDHLTVWVLYDLQHHVDSLYSRDEWIAEVTLQAVPA